MFRSSYFIDHSATDADGDSIVYELRTPYNGSYSIPVPSPPNPPPYNQINWLPPYSLNNMLGGNDLIAIDSQIAFINWNTKT